MRKTLNQPGQESDLWFKQIRSKSRKIQMRNTSKERLRNFVKTK